MLDGYNIKIQWDKQTQQWTIECPDFNHLATCGDTIPKALEAMSEAWELSEREPTDERKRKTEAFIEEVFRTAPQELKNLSNKLAGE